MSWLRAAVILALHIYVVWRAGQLRFRLETFGLYYPAPPYTVPAWRIEMHPVLLFLRQAGTYSRWVIEMDGIRRRGPEAWWGERHVAWGWPETESVSAIDPIG